MSISSDKIPLFHSSSPDSPCSSRLSEKLDDYTKREPSAPAPTPAFRLSRILIAGGGVGSLFLAILLERLGIPYYLFEEGSKVQHLGAALALGATVLPVFEQLGLTSLLASISLPCATLDIYDAKLKKLGSVLMKGQNEITGYENIVCSRVNLYELLLAQLNPANVVMNKKILSYEENELGVNVCCADNSIYCGDILVGADGPYSRIRQTMHRHMDKRGLLSKNDKERLTRNYVCVAGVTKQRSPEEYKFLKDPFVHFCTVVGGKGHGWHAVNIPDDQICWATWMHLDASTASQVATFETSEFGVENTEPIVKAFRDMPCPHGGTMGELVDATPEDLKSKVYIEEKLFDAWYYGRTVLIGSACHIMLPWAGQRELNEIHDAVILANCLFELKDLGLKSISASFKAYYSQRYPYAIAQFQYSRAVTRLVVGQTLKERISRYAILNWLPHSYQQRMHHEIFAYRPQASFMARAENRGRGFAFPQRSAKQWTEAEIERRISAVWNKRASIAV